MTAMAASGTGGVPRKKRRRSGLPRDKASRARVKALWQEYARTRSEELRNKLIEFYMPLVRLHAQKMKNDLPQRVEIEDLIAEGYVGLLKAVERFDPSRDNTFETYSAPRIRGAILDSLRENDWVPRPIRRRWNRLEEAKRRLMTVLGREPSEEELAEDLGLELDDLRKWQSEAGDIKVQVSLEGTCDKDERDMLHLEMLADDSQPHPIVHMQLEEVLLEALPTLPKREQDVVRMYYCQCMTMKEIGKVMGLSESRVCQIHNQAISCLRTRLGGVSA